MFFIVSKVLAFIADPMMWICIPLIISLIIKNKKPQKAKVLLLFGFSALLIFTNPLLINRVVAWWEPDTYTILKGSKPYSVGVLLSGATRGMDTNANRPVYGSGADRVLQTIDLFKNGHIRKILLTGGSGSLSRPEERESAVIAEVMRGCGIPDSCIFVENDSRNTYENAAMTAAFFKSHHQLSGSVLVITSALHMPRTRACFQKAGIIADYYPVDPGKTPVRLTAYGLIIPDATAIVTWDRLFHEWMGIVAYLLTGYI